MQKVKFFYEKGKKANEEENIEVSDPWSTGCNLKKCSKTQVRVMKCNINISWSNSSHLCGGSWIVRNHISNARFHEKKIYYL